MIKSQELSKWNDPQPNSTNSTGQHQPQNALTTRQISATGGQAKGLNNTTKLYVKPKHLRTDENSNILLML